MSAHNARHEAEVLIRKAVRLAVMEGELEARLPAICTFTAGFGEPSELDLLIGNAAEQALIDLGYCPGED